MHADTRRLEKMAEDQIKLSDRVRVHQRIRRADLWQEFAVEGEVVALQRRPTGSWYVHGKAGRLWLNRIVLRKPDGEESELVIDEQTQIERLT
jgi:hypothetical protein